MKESVESKKKRVKAIIRKLRKVYPDAKCALHFRTPFELLVATILSAQCTDKRVNMVLPGLFKKYGSIKAFAEADLTELEELIRSTGFYKNKAKNIRLAARIIKDRFNGQVPKRMEDLIQVPGAGRKTANVVLGNAFGIPGITVDTHMIRINNLLGFVENRDPVKIEFQLMELIPKKDWVQYTHLIILHGRARCVARRPDCLNCEIRSLCPSAE